MTLLNRTADLLQSQQSLDGRGISTQLGAKGTRRHQGLVLSSAYDKLCLFYLCSVHVCGNFIQTESCWFLSSRSYKVLHIFRLKERDFPRPYLICKCFSISCGFHRNLMNPRPNSVIYLPLVPDTLTECSRQPFLCQHQHVFEKHAGSQLKESGCCPEARRYTPLLHKAGQEIKDPDQAWSRI